MDSLFARPFELVPSLAVVCAVVAIGLLARLATDVESSWYKGLHKPHWQPPGRVFGIVWTLVYITFIVSAILAWHNTGGAHRTSLMVLYALNGALNVAWSFIFFRSRSPIVAAGDISGLLLTLIWPVCGVVPCRHVS